MTVSELRRTLFLFLLAVLPITTFARAQSSAANAADPAPQPAMSAILAAWDKYEVVAMPEAHGIKDLDDFILELIRNPAFPGKVNDIAVECANSLYQPILDRYIAGENVPFVEASKAWRNTTQEMCGTSGFFAEFFPLVRAINQKLPTARRVRVVACDPPVDWQNIKSFQDILNLPHRDANIAAVMEKEVLSRHRKALMLFGTFHLFHGAKNSAVSIYEQEYPNATFVVSELAFFDATAPSAGNPFAKWPVPSLVLTKGTWLGALELNHFFPAPVMIDVNCVVHNQFPKELQKPIEHLVDALLYLGPSNLALKEQMPAGIALDTEYRKELERRRALPGMPAAAGTLQEEDAEIILKEQDPLLSSTIPKPPDPEHPDAELTRAIQSCLDRKGGKAK